MKTLKTIQKLSGIGKVLCKIAFVFAVIGFCASAAGIISLCVGSDNVLKLGGVSLHGILSEKYGANAQGVIAVLIGWLIFCAGEAVLAKFAEAYFKNELKAETPFTLDGAKELLRLGILTAAIPTGCAVLGNIAEGIAAGFMDVEEAAALGLNFDAEPSIVLGIMFILGSLLCRYGAELKEENHPLPCEKNV